MTFEWPRYNDGWEGEDVKAFLLDILNLLRSLLMVVL